MKVLTTTLMVAFAWSAAAEPADQTVTLARYGEWELAQELTLEGRIVYRATLQDHQDKNRSLQMTCWPSSPERGFTFWLLDPTADDRAPRKLLVTFNNVRIGAIDQIETEARDGHVDVKKLLLELTGCGPCRTPPMTAPLFLSVLGRKMEFYPSHTDVLFQELARRCHFG